MDRDARLRELIESYAHVIHAAIARVTHRGRGNGDVGAEVIQRVSEALWKRLGDTTEIENPSAYLYRCAIRATLAILREHHAELELEPDALVSSSPSPEDSTRAARLALEVDRALATMTTERAAAVRAHLVGFSVDEIMRMHAWPYQKARNLVARGMADLRGILRERGFS